MEASTKRSAKQTNWLAMLKGRKGELMLLPWALAAERPIWDSQRFKVIGSMDYVGKEPPILQLSKPSIPLR